MTFVYTAKQCRHGRYDESVIKKAWNQTQRISVKHEGDHKTRKAIVC